MSAWWLVRYHLRPLRAPKEGLRFAMRPGAEPAAGLDHILGQAAVLLARARSVRDHDEVQRLLKWIDARLEERLRLTRT